MTIVGGAAVVQAGVRAGLVDELRLHVVPVLLGDGVRLFDGVDARLQLTRVVDSPRVTHLTYRFA